MFFVKILLVCGILSARDGCGSIGCISPLGSYFGLEPKDKNEPIVHYEAEGLVDYDAKVPIPEVEHYYTTFGRKVSEEPQRCSEIENYLKKAMQGADYTPSYRVYDKIISWEITSKNSIEVMVWEDLDEFRRGFEEILNYQPQVEDPILKAKEEYEWGYFVKKNCSIDYGYIGGIRVGDIIRTVDGEKVGSQYIFKSRIIDYQKAKAGDRVLVGLIRDGREMGLWFKCATYSGLYSDEFGDLVDLESYEGKTYTDVQNALNKYAEGIPSMRLGSLASAMELPGNEIPAHSTLYKYSQKVYISFIYSSAALGGVLVEKELPVEVFRYELEYGGVRKKTYWYTTQPNWDPDSHLNLK